MLRWLMLLAATLAGVAVGGYVAVCIAARLTYRKYLYPAPPDEAPALPPGAKWLAARSDDGATANAAFFPPPLRGAPAVVMFHGNGETIRNGLGLAQELVARGLGAVLVEYRGYGVSKAAGPPGERGIYDDAESILDALAVRGIGSDRIALVGFSLGTGVAAEMARRGRGAMLTLVSPYTSIAAVCEPVVPYLPVRLLLPDNFDTLAKAPSITVPTLIAHGDMDEVVPFAMGQALAAAIPRAAFAPFPGAHHGDLFSRCAGVATDVSGCPAGQRLVDLIAAHAHHEPVARGVAGAADAR